MRHSFWILPEWFLCVLLVGLAMIWSMPGFAFAQKKKQKEQLPEHAVKSIGDRRYAFNAEQIQFLDEDRIAAFNSREAAIIDVKSGEVSRIPGDEGFNNLLPVERRGIGKEFELEIEGKVMDVLPDGSGLLLDFPQRKELALVELKTGKTLDSWDYSEKLHQIRSGGFGADGNAIGLMGYADKEIRKEKCVFVEYAPKKNEFGRFLSSIDSADDESYFRFQMQDNGTWVALGGLRGSIWVHNFKTRETRWVGKLKVSCLSMNFPPVEDLLLTTGASGYLDLWDTANAAQLLKIRTPYSGVCNACLSPDRNYIATCLGGRIRFYSAKTGGPVDPIGKVPLSLLKSIAISPEQNLVAVAGDKGSVEIWNLRTGRRHRSLQIDPFREGVTRWDPQPTTGFLKFSNDSKLLIGGSGNTNNVMRVWDVKSGKLLQGFEGHRQPIVGVDWSKDNGRYASICRAGKLRVVDKDQGVVYEGAGYFGKPKFVDGRDQMAVVGDRTNPGIHGLDLKTGQILGTLDDSWKVGDFCRDWEVSADGKLLAAYLDDWTIIVWNIKSGEKVFETAPDTGYRHSWRDCALAFSKSGDFLASSPGTGKILVYHLSKKKLHRTLKAEGRVRALAFTDEQLVSASDEHHLMIWDYK